MALDKEQQNVQKRLKIASVLCVTFICVEVIGGLIAGSLTVLSDAAHLLADLTAFGVALIASHLASRPASENHTYGFKRVEALAALFSVSSLALLSILLALEGFRRLWFHLLPLMSSKSSISAEEMEVDGKLMTIIASIGVAVNVALALVLGEEGHSHSHNHAHAGGHGHDHSHGHDHHAANSPDEHTHLLTKDEESQTNAHGHSHSHDHTGHETAHEHTESSDQTGHEHACSHHDKNTKTLPNEIPPESPAELQRNINLHSAYLHVLGDLLQSIAVVIAGVVIWIKPTWTIIDPICTILFCVLVMYSTLSVFRTSLNVLLEEVPIHLDWNDVFSKICAVKGVSNVHDLHIWSVSHGAPALSVHLSAEDPDQALEDVAAICRSLNIGHPTVQVQENTRGDCIVCIETNNLCY
jgi:zinc transporter 2